MTLGGAILGASIGVTLHFLGLEEKVLLCVRFLASKGILPMLWKASRFWNVLVFCTILGAIIGFLWGIMKKKQSSNRERARKEAEKARKEEENSKLAYQQRIKWAESIKERALEAHEICSNLESEASSIAFSYEAINQMDNIVSELTDAIELQGRVCSIAQDVLDKEGVLE